MSAPASPPDRADVVVVGAGLAGLNAARELRGTGLAVVVLEGAREVGGRVSTDIVDGRLLDRGFQLYNPAYPEGARVLDYDRLALRPFAPGVRVLRRRGTSVIADPRHRLAESWGLVRGIPGGPLAGARFARYLAACGYLDAARIKARPDAQIGQTLDSAVRSPELMESLVRPFLAGVFGDWELTTSRHYADLVLRSFARGTPSLPAQGMSEIPRSMAAGLGSGVVHCGVPVAAVTPTEVHHEGGTIAARQVIVATDGAAAADLVPGVPLPAFNALTTWYFLAGEGDLGPAADFLMIDGDRRGILANIAAVSAVAPGYSRSGELLIAATAVGRHAQDTLAREHLSRALGAGAGRWPMLARYEIPRALPAFPVGAPLRGRQDFDGILVAGDHRDTPSIQGALVSGRRAARTAMARLGVGRSSRSFRASLD